MGADMFYLISTYWIWMVLALVLGAVAGWLIAGRDTGWSRIALGLFVAGLVVAVLKLLPGSWGLWLETALLLFASYMIGGLLAWLYKGKVASGPATSAALAGASLAAAPRAVAAPARPTRSFPGMKPAGLAGPMDGKGDDLKLVKGIGPKNESILNGLGVYQFKQIAGWSADECKWVGHKIAFPGRVERELWVHQAQLLGTGEDTEFSKAVKSGTIKLDANADSPLGEAEIVRLGTDIKARAAAADSVKAAEASRLATAARSAEAARISETTKAAEAARLGEAARAAEAQKVAVAAKAAEAQRHVDTAKAAEAHKAAEAAKTAAPHPGTQPARLASADAGKGDELKLIKGIGPKNEVILHFLGTYHFSQIADWKAPEETWVGHHMAFPGRVEREHWVAQARLLAAGMDTDHSRGVKAGTIAVDASADAPMSDEEAAKLQNALPEAMAAVAGEDKFEGKRPLGLVKPRGSMADDLKRIKGIGPQNEGRLQGLGIWHFDQIAAWTAEQVKWVGGYLAFPGRIDREEWIQQAKALAAGKTGG